MIEYGEIAPTDPKLLKKYERKLYWETVFIKYLWRFFPKLRKEREFKKKCEVEAERSILQMQEMIKKRNEERELRNHIFKGDGIK